MASSNLLSPADIHVFVSQTAEEIKQQMQEINKQAAANFYGGGSAGTYSRTGGFDNLGANPEESGSGKTITLTYKYSASDLSVNGWDSPWGISYPGSPDWAFDTGFVHGVHGGPRPSGLGGWSWNGVSQSTPIWEMIVEGINSLQ